MKEEDGEMVPLLRHANMGNSVYSTPVVAGNVLYISQPDAPVRDHAGREVKAG